MKVKATKNKQRKAWESENESSRAFSNTYFTCYYG